MRLVRKRGVGGTKRMSAGVWYGKLWLVVPNGSAVAFRTGNRGWWYETALRWHLVRETVAGGTKRLCDGIWYENTPLVVPNGSAVAFRTGNRGWWYETALRRHLVRKHPVGGTKWPRHLTGSQYFATIL